MNSKLQSVLGDERTGDIARYFKTMDDIVERNSGVGQTRSLQTDAADPPCPVANGVYTKLKVTNSSIHITNIDKSSITAQVDLKVTWHTRFWESILRAEEESDRAKIEAGEIVPNTTKLARIYRNKMIRWFIGAKASIHFFDAYRFYSNGIKTACEQTEAIYESTITRFLKPQEELDEKPDIYTTWKRANAGDECVCGTYISLQDLIDCAARNEDFCVVKIELCVPYDDFLPLSAFTMFPNKVFGDIYIELKLGLQSNLIVCQVDPKLQFEQMMKQKMLQSQAINCVYNHLLNDIPAYCKAFTQIPDTFNSTLYSIDANGIFTNHTVATTFACQTASLVYCRANINGFNIKNEVLRYLREKYSQHSLIVPAQTAQYHSFSQKPNSTSLHLNTTVSLVNTSAIIFLFPRTHSELTVSKNPHFSSIQAQIADSTYPDKPMSTHSIEHCMYVLTNAGLDSIFSPSEELSYSLTYSELHDGAKDQVNIEQQTNEDGEVVSEAIVENINNLRYPYKDNTSYCYVVSTERLSGYGTYCDGLTYDNAHITLTANVRGNARENPYIYDQRRRVENIANGIARDNQGLQEGMQNDRSPIMIIVQDCFWEMRTDRELRFIRDNKYAYEQILIDQAEHPSTY